MMLHYRNTTRTKCSSCSNTRNKWKQKKPHVISSISLSMVTEKLAMANHSHFTFTCHFLSLSRFISPTYLLLFLFLQFIHYSSPPFAITMCFLHHLQTNTYTLLNISHMQKYI